MAQTDNWMGSDPAQQTASIPSYPDGYPLRVTVPTDLNGDNLTVTATTVPAGTFYFNGTTFNPVTVGMVLFSTASSINLLDDLVYRPTASTTEPSIRPSC